MPTPTQIEPTLNGSHSSTIEDYQTEWIFAHSKPCSEVDWLTWASFGAPSLIYNFKRIFRVEIRVLGFVMNKEILKGFNVGDSFQSGLQLLTLSGEVIGTSCCLWKLPSIKIKFIWSIESSRQEGNSSHDLICVSTTFRYSDSFDFFSIFTMVLRKGTLDHFKRHFTENITGLF